MEIFHVAGFQFHLLLLVAASLGTNSRVYTGSSLYALDSFYYFYFYGCLFILVTFYLFLSADFYFSTSMYTVFIKTICTVSLDSSLWCLCLVSTVLLQAKMCFKTRRPCFLHAGACGEMLWVKTRIIWSSREVKVEPCITRYNISDNCGPQMPQWSYKITPPMSTQ